MNKLISDNCKKPNNDFGYGCGESTQGNLVIRYELTEGSSPFGSSDSFEIFCDARMLGN